MATWIEHVQKYRQLHNVTYAQALKGASASWEGNAPVRYRSASSSKSSVDSLAEFQEYVATLTTETALTASQPGGELSRRIRDLNNALKYAVPLLMSKVVNVMPEDTFMKEVKISKILERKLIKWQKKSGKELLVISERILMDHDGDKHSYTKTPRAVFLLYPTRKVLSNAIEDKTLEGSAASHEYVVIGIYGNADEVIEDGLTKFVLE